MWANGQLWLGEGWYSSAELRTPLDKLNNAHSGPPFRITLVFFLCFVHLTFTCGLCSSDTTLQLWPYTAPFLLCQNTMYSTDSTLFMLADLPLELQDCCSLFDSNKYSEFPRILQILTFIENYKAQSTSQSNPLLSNLYHIKPAFCATICLLLFKGKLNYVGSVKQVLYFSHISCITI